MQRARRLGLIVAQRLAGGIGILIVVSAMIFFSISLLPGDFATEMLGMDATPETVAALKAQLGLDQPVHIRFLTWVGDVFQGNFGKSLASNRDIAELIAPRFRNTMMLAGMAALIAIPLALGLGLLSVFIIGTRFDRILNFFTLSTVSFPEFFIAYVMIVIFAMNLHWLPTISSVSSDDSLQVQLWKMLMPAIVLSVVVIGHMMRMTRASITNLMSQPYIEMAILKGASRWRTVFHHALANAWAPIITVIVFNMAYLVVGVVVIELIFVYPGLGQLMVDAVIVRDVPLIQACTLIFASCYILLNMVADVVAIVMNPRLLQSQ